jgi:hypothetical protein
MNPITVLAIGIAVAGLVAYVAHLVGNARRMKGTPLVRSIPEGIERARRGRRRILVAWVAPGDKDSDRLLEAMTTGELEQELRLGFELVRIDAPEADREVIQVLATKYGLEKLVVPSLLALDNEGKKIGALQGKDAFGDGASLNDKVRQFAEQARI